jgi:similar to spore coat protein
LFELEGVCMTKYLGLHETLDLHELLSFKNLCLTKATTMSVLAVDAELKAILSADVSTGTQHIQQLQQFLTNRRETS